MKARFWTVMKQIGCPVRHQTVIDVYDYWNRLRGAGEAPLKSQIEPSSLGHFLPSLFILEKSGDDIITFRLAGAKISDLFGRDLRDESFSDLFGDGYSATIEATIAGAMRHTMPALINVTGYSTAGHRAAFEIAIMPLRSEDGHCERMLGVIAAMTVATWLEVVPLDFLVLDRCRALRSFQGAPDGVWPAAPRTPRQQGLAGILGRVVSSFRPGSSAR